MARGFAFVQSAAQDIEARKNSGGGGGKLFFKLGDGDEAIVRFLEQGEGVHGAWVHELPPPQGRLVGDKIPCRKITDKGYTTNECPGCNREYKRSFQGAINIIWRGAPLFERDSEGKLVKDNGRVIVAGQEDQIAVWVAGVTVFELLSEKDSVYKGLCSRDFKVKRKGTGFNTKYTVEPADPDGGPKPLSAADETLAAEKYDLTSYEEAPSFEEWGRSGRNSGTGVVAPADTSPFMRNR